MKVNLEIDRSALSISVPDEKIAGVLVGKQAAAIKREKIEQIITDGIIAHCPVDISQKKIVIIIPDDTRLWARGDLFVPHIVKALLAMGVHRDQIKIIIALGTHKDMSKEKYAQLAGSFSVETVEILNSANKNRDRLVYTGKTSRNTRLYFTKEAMDADHVIIFGGILHHLVAGFGGGRKYILPGIAGFESIQQNHSLTIRADGTPHPMARTANLTANPIHEDCVEAADLFLKNKTSAYVAVAANGRGEIFHCEVGSLHATFLRGCQKLNQECSIQVPQLGDFALISAGGHRTDGQLYQAAKALFNAVNIVKDNGDILFVAGCVNGVGDATFASVLADFRNDPRKLGQILAKNFNMPAV